MDFDRLSQQSLIGGHPQGTLPRLVVLSEMMSRSGPVSVSLHLPLPSETPSACFWNEVVGPGFGLFPRMPEKHNLLTELVVSS